MDCGTVFLESFEEHSRVVFADDGFVECPMSGGRLKGVYSAAFTLPNALCTVMFKVEEENANITRQCALLIHACAIVIASLREAG